MVRKWPVAGYDCGLALGEKEMGTEYRERDGKRGERRDKRAAFTPYEGGELLCCTWYKVLRGDGKTSCQPNHGFGGSGAID